MTFRLLVLALTLVALAGASATAHAQIVSPQSLTYEPRTVGTRSASQSVFVRNPGPGNMTVPAPVLSGPHAGDFSFLNGCPEPPNVLGPPGPGSECSIAVIFTPQAEGERTATLTVTVNRESGTETYDVALRGTGTPPPAGSGGAGGTAGGTGTDPGGGGGTGSPSQGSAPELTRFTAPARARLRTVRARGLTLRLRAERAPRVVVRVWLGRRLFYARTFTLRARLTLAAGVLRRALRSGRYEVWVTPVASDGRRGATLRRRVRIVR